MNDINIDVNLLFSVPIGVSNIPVNVDTLKNHILELSKKEKGIYLSNDGGWHSEAFTEPYNEIRELWNTINDSVNSFHESLKLKGSVHISSMWYNINYRGCANNPHDHPHSIHSGVFYINTPENCGNICFTNPNEKLHWAWSKDMSEIPPSTVSMINFELTPKVGNHCIFPSWMNHLVQSNLSNEPRISLSYNTIWKP